MLDVLGDGSNKAGLNTTANMDQSEMEGIEQDIDDFFDFVVIDEAMYQDY